MKGFNNTGRSSLKPKLLGSRLLATSWRIRLYEDLLRFDDEKDSSFKYARLSIPSFATVVAERQSDGKFAIVRQYRVGARKMFWEFPAGLVESGEHPISTVKREFEEEVGFKLLKAKLLAKCYANPSRSAQVAYIYSGKIGMKTRRHLDGNERLEVRFVSDQEALSLISQRISSIYLLAFMLRSSDESKKAKENKQQTKYRGRTH